MNPFLPPSASGTTPSNPGTSLSTRPLPQALQRGSVPRTSSLSTVAMVNAGAPITSARLPFSPGITPKSFSGNLPFVANPTSSQGPTAGGPPVLGQPIVSVAKSSSVPGLPALSGPRPLNKQYLPVQLPQTPGSIRQRRLDKFRQDIADAKRTALLRCTIGLYKKISSVDLLFLLDTTGSMTPYINTAKNKIRAIVAETKDAFFDEILIRISVVGYKDHGDSPNIEFLDFTSNVTMVYQFLERLVGATRGGADLAEDVLGGIQQAIEASWQETQETRCLIHIADAPPHGSDLHDMHICHDRFYIPKTEPRRLDYEELIRKLVSKNINYALLRINESTDRMALAFSNVYYREVQADVKLLQTNRHHQESMVGRGRAHMRDSAAAGLQFEEHELGTASDKLESLVIKSINNSASRTANRLSNTGNMMAGIGMRPAARLPSVPEERPIQVLEKVAPQWTNIGWFDEELKAWGLCPNLATHNASTFDGMMTQDDRIRLGFVELVIKKRSRPFDQGASRMAAYARTAASETRFVVKSFKKKVERIAELAEHMQCQALCKAFAIEFNALLEPKHPIDFVITVALTNGDKYLSLEPYIDGKYTKYNDNVRYVDSDEADLLNQTAQAFSHFTFERSRGRLLVNDLQGVDNFLTDPAIQTRDKNRFTLCGTNLNWESIKSFMGSHNCNDLCRQLQLKSNKKGLKDGSVQFRTDWPEIENMTYCSNMLCRRILHISPANKLREYPGYWCPSCRSQLTSTTIPTRLLMCRDSSPLPNTSHLYHVSEFFLESQGGVAPSQCPLHRPDGLGFPPELLL